MKAPAFGGMQEKFRAIVNDLDLEVVERRTNRDGRGLNATVQTDLYVRDTTMTTQLRKISAQKKIKDALHQAITASSTDLQEQAKGPSALMRQGSVRVSSRTLSNVSLASLDEEDQERVTQAAEEEDKIIARGDAVKKAITEALGNDADVAVDVWNPWPWTEVLDKIAAHFVGDEIPDRRSLETYVAVFDKIDADGGGQIDQAELYEALCNAGLDITEEGVITLMLMIDEDGNGDVDRDEWKETVEFYLELKEEEYRMKHLESQQDDMMKRLREKKLADLNRNKSTAVVEEAMPVKQAVPGEGDRM